MANETPKDANEVNKALQTREQIVKNISRLNKEQQENFKASLNAIKDINAEEDKLNQLLGDTQDALDKVSNSLSFAHQSFKDSVNEMKKGNEYLNMQKGAVSKLSDIARTALDIRKGENVLEDKKYKQLQEQAKQRRQDLELSLQKGKFDEAEKEALKDQIKTAYELEASMKGVLATDEEILKNLGFAPKVVAGIDKAISKLGLPEMGFKDALDKTRMLGQEAAANGVTNFKAMSVFTGLVLKNIKEALSFANLMTLGIGAAAVALIDADKHTGELAKNLGTSYDEAIGFHHEMTEAANESEYLLVTTKDLINAQMKLSDAIGTGNNLSKELLSDFAGLTEQAGYSEEAMLSFSKIVSSTGGSLKDTTSEMLRQIELLNQQNGLSINSKQLTEEISKTASATVLTYGRSGEALAKAAFQAKQVGINLQQAQTIAEGLLNFESSITSELEAELLTGKDLNLEKARQLALEGKVAEAAKEALKNIKSAEEFTKMNVIQQEALAKATGLSRDDLAKSLMEREALARLGKQEGNIQEEYNKLKEQGLSSDAIAAKLGDKKLADQLASVSAQEKLAAVSDRLKEIFTSLVTPLLPVLQIIGDIVSAFTPLFRMIGQVVKFTVEWGKYLVPVIAGFYTLKFLGDAQYRTILLSNAARKIGLITERQAEMAKKSQSVLAKGTLLTEGQSEIVQKRKLGNAILTNIQEKLGLNTKEKGLFYTIKESAIKAKDFVVDKGKLTIQYLWNAAKAVGNTLSTIGKAIAKSDLVVSIGKAAMNVINSLASIPIVGWALGLAAAAGTIALGYKFMKGDDVMSQGYGKRTLLAGKDAIALNDDDTVIAGTDLGGKKKGKAEGISSPSIDITPLIDRMAAVEGVLQQILSKETNIYLDSTKVGTGFAVASSRVQ